MIVDTANQELVQSLGGNLNNSNISAVGGLVITSGALTGTVCGLLFLVSHFFQPIQEKEKEIDEIF